ncbi:MAG: thiolase domain-containing protein [Nitrososphaerales archaeon]
MAKRLCSLVSAGCSQYGKREGLSGKEIFNEALSEMFANCEKLDKRDVKALYLGQAFESFEHQANTAAGISNDYGFENIPSVRIDSVSASGGGALRQAVLGIMSGEFDLVICGGVEKMTNVSTSKALEIISMAANRPYEQQNGATLTSLNALAARMHMSKFGTSEEDLALVAVKNHKNAFENPKAYFHKLINVKDVLESRPISTPLKLLDCSPICDGASALALCSGEIATKFTDDPIDIIGSAEASDCDFIFRKDYTSFAATQIASKKAYSIAETKEIDFAEVHDAFTINELIAYEDLGFCKKGDGRIMVEKGETELNGRLPVNTSGGLKAKGHPVGSSGTGQAYEVFTQMRGLVPASRKVKNPKVALTHSMGGAGVTVQVHIYKRRNA